MTIIAFDTHEFISGLTAAGMPKKQAEFLSKTYSNLLDERLVTKHDLKYQMGMLRADLKHDLSYQSLITTGLTVTLIGLMLTLFKFIT